MTPEERSESARIAAQARWLADLPKATHDGPLKLGDFILPCAVLSDGRRVLTQEGFLHAIGRARKAKGGQGASLNQAIPPFLIAENLRPFVTDELIRSASPIVFRTKTGQRAYGFLADILADVCWVFIKAKMGGALAPSQEHIVERCQQLLSALGKVGIIALIDEATGYQADRARDELQRLVEQFIAPELRPWTSKFPHEFFREIFRLQGWEYKPGLTKSPRYVGKLINDYVYRRLPPGVLDKLRERNPVVNGQRKHKHFQFLTEETGEPALDYQIRSVTLLMRISDDKKSFQHNLEKAFPIAGDQRVLPLPEPESDGE